MVSPKKNASAEELICLSVKGTTKETRDAVSRSYSPKTIEIMQQLDARAYTPKVGPGTVYFGGIPKNNLTDSFYEKMKKEGYVVQEISCHFLPLQIRKIFDPTAS